MLLLSVLAPEQKKTNWCSVAPPTCRNRVEMAGNALQIRAVTRVTVVKTDGWSLHVKRTVLYEETLRKFTVKIVPLLPMMPPCANVQEQTPAHTHTLTHTLTHTGGTWIQCYICSLFLLLLLFPHFSSCVAPCEHLQPVNMAGVNCSLACQGKGPKSEIVELWCSHTCECSFFLSNSV